MTTMVPRTPSTRRAPSTAGHAPRRRLRLTLLSRIVGGRRAWHRAPHGLVARSYHSASKTLPRPEVLLQHPCGRQMIHPHSPLFYAAATGETGRESLVPLHEPHARELFSQGV